MKRSRLIAGVLALIMGVSSFPTASVMNVSAAETYVAEEAEDAADEAATEQEVSQDDSSVENSKCGKHHIIERDTHPTT